MRVPTGSRKFLLFLPIFFLLSLAACTAPTPIAAPVAIAPTNTAIIPTATPIPVTPSPTPLASLTPVPTPMPGGLYVDPGASLGPISRFSYGTNYGPWSILPVELYDAYKDSGITFIRFPGGEWGDQNNIQPQQIDDFVKMARSINAEPQISVRLNGGTPAAAAALVKYTVDKGYNVKYWSIGNEPDLYDTQKKTWPSERIVKEWRAIALAMRAVDPGIKLIGPELHKFYPNPRPGPDTDARETLKQFLKVNGDLVDIISIHHYPFPIDRGEPLRSRADVLASRLVWDQSIPELRAIIREVAGRDMPIAVTEFNSNSAYYCCSSATPDSTLGALWLGDVMGRLIRQKVDVIAQFSMRITQGGQGIFGSYSPNPAFYVYQLYKRFGEELIYSSSDDDNISIYSARRKDGALTLIVFNMGDKDVIKSLMLKGLDTPRDAELYRFDASHKADRVPAEKLGGKSSVVLPANSMSLYIVR